MKKTNDMKKKWYTLGEITDEFVGVKSAPERERLTLTWKPL